MRTRNQSKRQNQSTGKEMMEPPEDSNFLESLNDGGILASISRGAVGKLLNRVNSHGSSGLKNQDNYLRQCDSAGKPESKPERAEGQGTGKRTEQNSSEGEGCCSDAIQSTPLKVTVEEKNPHTNQELAELVHKVHLLCLLGRGRLIDNTCNDPLIQASLLLLLPTHLLRISDVTKLTVNALAPLVNCFTITSVLEVQAVQRDHFIQL